MVGEAVGLPQSKKKLGTGMSLIRTFCVPQKPTKTNGGRTRTLPHHEPEKWDLFKRYCMQDVEAEREIERRLSPWPMPPQEQRLWQLDCRSNAAGVLVDKQLVDGALYCGEKSQADLLAEAKEISGLANPRSVTQLLKWIQEELEDDEIPDLRKATVKDILDKGVTSDRAERMLEIRQQIGKTSTKKYDAMRAAQGDDGRVRGLLQYYGASRTGRWAGRLVQVQNLPRNYLETLDFARGLVCAGNLPMVQIMYGNVPDTLSQLIRTAFIPSPGKMFLVADFSAIEARVIAWLAGETWRLDVFATHGKIYEASASAMFGVPIEKIVKGEPEYELRQKGKVAELALGYGGGPGALIDMGALKMGISEDELPDIVERWRSASPNIVQLWRDLESAALRCVRDGDPLNYDGSTNITATNTKTYSQSMIVVGRAKAWVEKDFSADITGEDFMDNVAQQVAAYWDDVDQDTLLAILEGIFSMTGANKTNFVDNHTYDISDKAAAAANVGATTLNLAIQQAAGDNKDIFRLVICHSAVATNLENLSAVEYLKYTDSKGVERSLGMTA